MTKRALKGLNGISRLKLIRIWKITRLILFIGGFASIFWFFFAFIGVAIGLTLFIWEKDRTWKAHGLMLAFSASLSNFIAHKLLIIPPLQLAMLTGPIIMASYMLIHLITESLAARSRLSASLLDYLYGIKLKSIGPAAGKVFKLAIIAVPITLWSVVSLDFGVMFNNSPQLLWINGPTTVNVGDSFDLTVESWDSYERLSAIYTGKVHFEIESYNRTTFAPVSSVSYSLPEDYKFTGQKWGSDMAYSIKDGKDNGKHVFSVSISTPGIHYIVINDSISQNIYYSNPIIVDDFENGAENIYWGDLHTHSIMSDGSGSPEHNFGYAEDIACLDYCALTDHGEILLFQLGAFDFLEALINDANKPGDFVTFQGYEWTDVKTGHYSCIFDGDHVLKHSSFLTTARPDDLWNLLDDFTSRTGSRALALPHHSTKKSYIHDWTYADADYVRIAEVCSVHGDFLYEQRDALNYRGAIDPPPVKQNGSSVIDALKMGTKIALYGSSDTHDGHPGHSLSHTDAFIGHQRPLSTWHTRNEHPYPGGITAVFAEDLSRASVFTSLYNQKIYVCSDHGRPYLNFTINGTSIGDGSTLTAASVNDERNLSIEICLDGSPAATYKSSALMPEDGNPNWNADVEIIKNGNLLATIPISGPVADIKYIDNEPIKGADYGVQSCIEKNGEYYINEYSDKPIDPSTLNTNGADYYIVRIVCENGRHIYAGPIWVDV